MVNDSGQLYTMEGVAAGLIMLVTAYIIISTTSVYTAGDTHIPDMQLEQLGSDVLAMMDTPDTAGDISRLNQTIRNYAGLASGDSFRTDFLNLCNLRAGQTADTLHMQAYVYYRSGNEVRVQELCSPDPSYTGRESAVRVTRWVQLTGKPSGLSLDARPQAVLVEVLLWRD